jgi:hypothetical protein
MLCLWHGVSPAYHFPSAQPFRGDQLFNPYAQGAERVACWWKVNLHAHSRAWAGLTNGRSTAQETVSRYRAMGYDVASVSNYNEIATTRASELAVYEQGYNLIKSHLLVVGAHHVDWWDYPIFQGVNEKQDRIDRLRGDGALVVVAHPELRLGFSTYDLERLTGYDAIEVASHFGNGERFWDAGLSAGRLSAALGGDDSHNSSDPRQTGHVWTMISAPSVAPADIIAAIRAGGTYVVVSSIGQGRADVALQRVETRGDTIEVSIDGEPATIRFIGQNGRALMVARNTRGARYVLPRDEPYARAVVETPRARLILNPVVRTPGGRPGALAASTRGVAPVTLTAGLFLLVFSL